MTDSFLIVPELSEILNKLELFYKGSATHYERELYADAKSAVRSLLAIERGKKMREELLLKMLEIACGLLNENEICTYCKANMYGDCRGCVTDDFCTANIFDGLEIEAKKKLKINKECA